MALLVDEGEPFTQIVRQVVGALAMGEFVESPQVSDLDLGRPALVGEEQDAPEFKSVELFAVHKSTQSAPERSRDMS